MRMRKTGFFVGNLSKTMVFAVVLLFASGVASLFAEDRCIESMKDLFPELNIDGAVQPNHVQKKPKDTLEGLGIPPKQRKGGVAIH